jgi:hypothetical protein
MNYATRECICHPSAAKDCMNDVKSPLFVKKVTTGNAWIEFRVAHVSRVLVSASRRNDL